MWIGPERTVASSPVWGLAHWQLLALFANVIGLCAAGHGGDLQYWRDWLADLQAAGYAGYRGNYPPLYVHWFYVCAQLARLLSIPLIDPLLVKALVVAPVILCHLLLVRVLYGVVTAPRQHLPASDHGRVNALMALTALNPAILLDGPVWGQVDLLPALLVVLALLGVTREGVRIWVLPLYVLALLTKFQTIAFAPIFAAIWLSDVRGRWRAAALAAGAAAVFMAPLAWAGVLLPSLKAAYLDTLAQYPFASLYAANIWRLFYPNGWPDDQPLLPWADDLPGGELLTIKAVGIGAFMAASVGLFWSAMVSLAPLRRGSGAGIAAFKLPALGLLAAAAFFVLLPGMHERYLFPAVPVALLLAAVARPWLNVAAIFSVLVAINLLLVLPLSGELFWRVLSGLVALVSVWMGGEVFAPRVNVALEHQVHKLVSALKIPVEGIALGLGVMALAAAIPFISVDPNAHRVDLTAGQVWLSALKPRVARQDWGRLEVDANLSGAPLRVGGYVFSRGLGSHANAYIEYDLQQRYAELSFRYGLDDRAGRGEVELEVWVDDRQAWASGPIAAWAVSDSVSISLANADKLVFKLGAKGAINGDHLDILYPVLTVAAPGAAP